MPWIKVSAENMLLILKKDSGRRSSVTCTPGSASSAGDLSLRGGTDIAELPCSPEELSSSRFLTDTMEAPVEEDGSSSPNLIYKAAHEAFRDRWKETDDTMCRHSMSFHLHHTLRSEFFASYLYLVEKIPLGTSPARQDL